MVKVFLGADHAGYKLKEEIKVILDKAQVQYEDLAPKYNEGDDYPDIALKVCEKILETKSMGILICGSGVGISIAANKVPGIRAALCHNARDLSLSREHNDANVLCLSGWMFDKEFGPEIVRWFNTPFEGGRHQRRVDKINKIEEYYSK